jgi:energy-coupling factor transport system ATP-binding protein
MEIRLHGVSFRYRDDHSNREVLQDLHFVLSPGECVALLGPSGSGKSTLAQILNGLLRPVQGSVFVDGIELTYKPEELKKLRERVGLVFQFPEAQIFEPTVYDEVAFAAKQSPNRSDQLTARVHQALTAVGLDPDRFDARNPFRLSGGEARLVTIASLLVVDPDWLILDEPTLGLDCFHTQKIIALLRRRREHLRGTLLITHDLDLAAAECPRVLVLVGGVLKYDGSSTELFANHDLHGEFCLEDSDLMRLWKKLRSHFSEIGALPPAALTDWICGANVEKRRSIAQILNEELSPWNTGDRTLQRSRE